MGAETRENDLKANSLLFCLTVLKSFRYTEA